LKVADAQQSGWMQRIKDQGQDPAKPIFSNDSSSNTPQKKEITNQPPEISMTKPGLDRKISIEELKAHSDNEHPWFVVHGEVNFQKVTDLSFADRIVT
jgi:nitrate reductase (NAD(P)H)